MCCKTQRSINSKEKSWLTVTQEIVKIVSILILLIHLTYSIVIIWLTVYGSNNLTMSRYERVSYKISTH